MFDFDAGKLLIIGVVALIVIGPKDLPRVLRQVGQAVSRLRRMATEFQGQFMDAMKEAEFQDLRAEIAKVSAEAKLDYHFDPVSDVQSQLTRAVAPAAAVVSNVPAATDGFQLPETSGGGSALAAEADAAVPTAEPTAAAIGMTPVAPSEVTPAAADPAETEARPRRVVVAKRRTGVTPANRVEAASRPAPGRFRNVRPRRPEPASQ